MQLHDEIAVGVEAGMDARIEALFERCPALCGFSVRDPSDLPDSCARTETGGELFVTDIGISPRLGADQYGEIFNEIATTLSEMLAEEPGAGERLRGRTFARTLH
jgi:hypothetical protein